MGAVDVEGDAVWPVARLSGEIDLSNVDDLTTAVEAAVSNAAMGLFLDLSGVTYLDSTGLRLIFRLCRQLQDRQQQLRLVVPPTAPIQRVLQLGGVHEVVEVFASLSEALASKGAVS